jgi:hypothetical protein
VLANSKKCWGENFLENMKENVGVLKSVDISQKNIGDKSETS